MRRVRGFAGRPMGGIGGEGRGCGEDKISLHQIMVLSAVALLAPATTALPGQTARMAGGLSWTAPLLALPAVLALVWSLRRLCRRRGLAQAFEEILGRRWGRVLTAAYLLWGLLLLAAHGGSGVERLAAGGYGGGTWLPLAALLVLVLWVARGKTCTLARGAEIFKLILAATLGAVLALSLSRMELRNLLPVTGTGGFGIPSAAAAILSRLGAGVYSGFLAGAVTPRRGDAGRAYGWAAGFCILMAAVQLVLLGNFGAEFTAQLGQPLFSLAKGVGVPGAFGRVEAAVAALWLLSDLTLLILLTQACCDMAQRLLGLQTRGAAAPVLAVLTLGGAALPLSETWTASGNLIFGFALPLFIAAVAGLRKEHI